MIVLAALIGLLLQHAAATPSVVKRSSYYEIVGSSVEELRASIDRQRPRDKNGDRHDAVTEWTVRWDYRYTAEASVCALTSFATSLSVSTRLPRWSRREKGSSLARRWDRYIEALEEHERGHARIAQRAAQAVQDRVSAIAPVTTCPLLIESIRSTGEDLIALYRSEDAEYDRRTSHGVEQGARFP